MAHSIVHLYLYVHFNISVIRLVVITQVILYHIAGHQGLPSVHAKLMHCNTVLLIAKMIGFVADENSAKCPYGT